MNQASCIPIPEGLELPEGQKQVDVVTTYAVQDGMLYPVAVDGIPLPEPEEGEMEGEGEGEMEAEGEGPGSASKAQGGSSMGADQGFMAAIEAALGKPKAKR
jgi:hypothetical protein